MNRLTIMIIIILGTAVAGGGIAFKIVWTKWKTEKRENESLVTLNSDAFDNVETYKNKLGQEVSKNQALTLRNGTLKTLTDNQEFKFLKDMEGLKRSLRNLESAQRITARAVGSINTGIRDTTIFITTAGGQDTTILVAKSINYEDEYTTITGLLDLKLDSVKLDYTVTVPLEGAVYWERKWFLGKKKWSSELISPNPNVTITELKNIRVRKKAK